MTIEGSDRWDAVGDPDLRATFAFVRAQPQSPNADDVAAGLGIPRSVARWRLERLAARGLLRAVFERRTGRTGPGAGRPAKTYAVVPETASLEFPSRHYGELVQRLVAALPTRGRSTRLHEIGAAFGHDLARVAALRPATVAPTALDRVCRALRQLGFQAVLELVTPKQAVFVTATCPLRPLVVADESLRRLDQGMWSGLIDSALKGPAPRIRCSTRGCLAPDAPCRVVVELTSR